MNEQDQEAFEKWFYNTILVNPWDSHKAAWKAGCEYARSDVKSLREEITGWKEAARSEAIKNNLLQVEINKLRDTLESIDKSKNSPESDYLSARDALKSVIEELKQVGDLLKKKAKTK
jgi:regulator of replication initiation timing